MELNIIIKRPGGIRYVELDDTVLALLSRYAGVHRDDEFAGEVWFRTGASGESKRFVPLQGCVAGILLAQGLLDPNVCAVGGPGEKEDFRTACMKDAAKMWQEEIESVSASFGAASRVREDIIQNELRGRKCYMSGPITGSINFKETFHKYSSALKEKYGIVPMNPVGTSELLDGKMVEYADYLAIDQQLVRMSDAVILLPGWGKSKGALFKYTYARVLDLPVFYVMPDMTLRLIPRRG